MKKFVNYLTESAQVKSKDLLKQKRSVLRALNGPQNTLTYHMETKGDRYVALLAKLGKVEVGKLFFQDGGYAGDSLEFSDPTGIFKVDVFYDIAKKLIASK